MLQDRACRPTRPIPRPDLQTTVATQNVARYNPSRPGSHPNLASTTITRFYYDLLYGQLEFCICNASTLKVGQFLLAVSRCIFCLGIASKPPTPALTILPDALSSVQTNMGLPGVACLTPNGSERALWMRKILRTPKSSARLGRGFFFLAELSGITDYEGPHTVPRPYESPGA